MDFDLLCQIYLPIMYPGNVFESVTGKDSLIIIKHTYLLFITLSFQVYMEMLGDTVVGNRGGDSN